MSLTTPIITPISSSFDATLQYVLNFTVGSSSDQVVANNLIVQRNSDNVEVYNQEIANFLYTHTIPASTLSNNTQYKAKIRTKNIDGIYSAFSDWILFYCYSPAIIDITNITEGCTVNNSEITVQGSYVQENDAIKSYRFILYDNNSILLESYPEIIGSNLTQLISGFQNNTSYHIELKTISQSNVEVSTGLIGFTVSYVAPVLGADLTLTNMPTSGSVKIDILAIQVEGIGNDFTYESDDWVNVTNDGAYVYFDKRLNLIVNDFKLRLHFRNIPSDRVFCTIPGDNGSLTIKYYDSRFHVFKTANGLTSHFINDTDITFISTDKICLEVNQINNLIDVTAQIYV